MGVAQLCNPQVYPAESIVGFGNLTEWVRAYLKSWINAVGDWSLPATS